MGHLSQCALQNSAMTKHPRGNLKKKIAANCDPAEVQNEKYFHPSLLCYCLHNT